MSWKIGQTAAFAVTGSGLTAASLASISAHASAQDWVAVARLVPFASRFFKEINLEPSGGFHALVQTFKRAKAQRRVGVSGSKEVGGFKFEFSDERLKEGFTACEWEVFAEAQPALDLSQLVHPAA